ncbi:uncharacterized protein Dana_GF20849 [Drosophila ananassae]|uniref:PPM-type phosphatase domain-containing protein n=1 Tax=Drosophila ananassae TaxID=7217 RepID=B3MS80_DROAN|nr:uncharacterized protein LOC6503541 [Drosophila ananassae]XP_044572683.1 uncharacterized protein LOC6503541 [Drosophila ananassae]EDV34635.2 uncharacterized protein Dana_GF20849 [Drosophila ananassae]
MLPANRSSSNSSYSNSGNITNTNRCLIKSAIERTVVRLRGTPPVATPTKPEEEPEDVTVVEYDIINFYADSSPRMSPRIVVNPRQLSPVSPARPGSTINSSHSSSPALDASSSSSSVVGCATPARRTVMEQQSSGGGGEDLSHPAGERKSQLHALPIAMSSRSRGGGGVASSRLRRQAAIVPARSIVTEANSSGNSSGNSASSSSSSDSSSSSPTPSSPCSTLGVNMRVTGQCSQGGRKYMEDQFSVAYQESPLTHELEYAFFGIYDGHGGPEAAVFAKEHLMLEIVKQKLFWSDKDEDVLRAIREGYIATHFAMWREQEKWPRTANGHLSTAGTTATVAFMRREKIYIGHVGDSGIVLGYQRKGERNWQARQLTTDHKPESLAEKTRIQRSGGNVAIKSGVPRVVWNRPRDPMHRGPIRRRTLVDDIPFLAVARSLGDLWSYNSRCKEFVVSPDPDVKVVKIDPSTFRCLIFGTDGLWNVVTPQEAVDCVRKEHLIGEILNEQDVMNPSKALVDQALKTWASKKMRADNTSVVTVILTPAASHTTTSNTQQGTAPQTPALARDPDMDVDLLVEAEAMTVEEEEDDVVVPVDSENSCPQEFFIEEEEYHLETPYSALAKRHLPPEPYRDFDYFGLDEDETEEDEEEPQPDPEEAEEHVEAVENWFKPRKTWRKSTINNSWTGGTEPEPDPEPDERNRLNDATPDLTMYSHTSIDKCAIYGNSVAPGSANPELEQHLESSYSFAESYNSLLNEQEEQEARSRSAAAAAAVVHSQSAAAQAAASCSVQEMIQEQQHYQQQEGYSLTQLETRRERERVAQESWQQPAELLELDALLQQERAEEEQVALEQQQQQQQQQQQREQQMEVASSSSGQQEFHYSTTNEWTAASEPEEVDGDVELEPELEPEPELQDNEVSSTLPPTPTEEIAVPGEELDEEMPSELPQKPSRRPEIKSEPKKPQKPEKKQQEQRNQEQGLVSMLAETVAEIRKEDAHAVHYIFEQIQKLQDADISPVSDKPGVGEALERASVLAGESSTANVSVTNSNTRIRQMRRYRNVPNENHQHMQTRRRQMFKPSKPKSFIGASAAAIVAYGDSNGAGSGIGIGGAGGTSSHPVEGRVGGGGVSGSGVEVASREINASAASRRRSGNVVASSSSTGAGSSSMMMTRRSHSLTASSGVNKRQLRSSLCSLGLGLGLDMTKRTLRTRNIPIATGGGEAGRSQPDVPVGGSASPASVRTPSAGSTPRPVPSRRLKRIHEDREQRRSLRRTTLSASSSGSIGGGVGGGSVGPSPGSAKSSRLQSCNGAISARPPPSPKKLNAAVPTLAIGTRAYTAALAAAADHLNKRWSLRSSSSSSSSNSSSSNTQNTNNNNSNLITAISCYSARSRGAGVVGSGATASPMGQPGGGGAGAGGGATRRR